MRVTLDATVVVACAQAAGASALATLDRRNLSRLDLVAVVAP